MSNNFELVLREKVNHTKLLKICDGDTRLVDKIKIGFINAVKKDRSIMACSDESLMTCLLESTEMGLPVGIGNLAYLIKYGNEAQFSASYLGLIKLLKDKFLGVHIVCELVYEGDEFSSWSENGEANYTFKPVKEFRSKDETPLGVFCYIKYKGDDGEYKSLVEKADITEVMEAKNSAKTKMVWNKWFVPMAKKFLLKRVIKPLIVGDKKFEAIIDADNDDYEMKDATPKKQQEGVNYDKFEPMDTDKPVDPAVDDGVIIDANVVDDSKDGIFD